MKNLAKWNLNKMMQRGKMKQPLAENEVRSKYRSGITMDAPQVAVFISAAA